MYDKYYSKVANVRHIFKNVLPKFYIYTDMQFT